MAPLRTKSTLNLKENEFDIRRAIKYLKNNKKKSIRSAAILFDVPRTTLQDRLKGVESIVIIRENNHKLTNLEEISLRQWILSMDLRGAAPRSKDVHAMANLLLAKRGNAIPQTLGLNWVDRFVKRQKVLKKKILKRP